MDKLNFHRNQRLENYEVKEIIEGDFPILVKLINDYVKILLTIENDSNITLYGYYKYGNTMGIARCALYFLLDRLLDENIISLEQNVNVSSPTPDDGNMERLIKIYQQIGFTLDEPGPGKPINLNSTVENLLKTLEKQCGDEEGIGKIKRQLTKTKGKVITKGIKKKQSKRNKSSIKRK